MVIINVVYLYTICSAKSLRLMCYIIGDLYCLLYYHYTNSNLVSYITTWYVKQEACCAVVVLGSTVISITIFSIIRGILFVNREIE